MKKQTVTLAAIFVLVLLGSGLASYFLFGRPSTPATRDETANEERADDAGRNNVAQDNAPPGATNAVNSSAAQANDDARLPARATTQNEAAQTAPARGNAGSGGESFFGQLFGGEEAVPRQGPPESIWMTAGRILLRFALAVLLATILAYRPRRRGRSMFQRNPYVSQTQILLAVVASALMMVVGDSAARAFGIFAAASLVRFRTNISDPKEITVLLVSLAIGLATGVGHWEVAIVLCLFVLVTLWVLEYYEPSQAFRPMEITITTRNVDVSNRVLRRVLRKHKLNMELREIDREDADEPIGRIVYHVNVSLLTSTDTLSNEIFSLDLENIDSIFWSQKKVPSIYT